MANNIPVGCEPKQILGIIMYCVGSENGLIETACVEHEFLVFAFSSPPPLRIV